MDTALSVVWQLARSSARALVVAAAMFVFIAWFEHRAGRDMRRYLRRAFAFDLLYFVFYQGGTWAMLFASLVGTWAEPWLQQFQWHLIEPLPAWAQAIAYWTAADFLAYWVHRTQHRFSALWAFHSLHHATEHLTFASSYRNHPAEQLMVSVVLLVPLTMLGMSPSLWFPFWLLMQLFEGLKHSQVDWTYGRLGSVFVSPRFHQVHHAPERQRHDGNYAAIFSVWDRLFGTAAADQTPPQRYGIEGVSEPLTVRDQLMLPFRVLRRRPDADQAPTLPHEHSAMRPEPSSDVATASRRDALDTGNAA